MLRILFFFLPCVLLFAPEAHATSGLDTMANTFQAASSGWMTNAQGYAKSLFLGLAGLEFTWAGIQYALRKGDLPDFLASVTLKVMGIGFFYSLLMEAPTWIPAIMNSFSQAGAAIGGTGGTPMTPSGIIDQGISIADKMNTSLSVMANGASSSMLTVLGNMVFSGVEIALAALLVIAAFTLVAIQLLVTLIESYIVIGGGMLMLGFLGSRWTLPFGEKYFGYAVSVGIKLFVLDLLVGAGGSLANAIIHHLQTLGHTPGPTDFFAAAAASMGYGVLGFMAPGLAGSMMNGSPSLSMANAAAATSGIAGTGISAAAKGGSALIGGTQAAQSIYDKTMGALKAGERAGGGIGGSPIESMLGGISGASSGGSGGGFAGGVSGSGPSAPPGMSGGASSPSGMPGVMGANRSDFGPGAGAGPSSLNSSSPFATSNSSMGSTGSGTDVKAKGGTDAIADPKDPKKGETKLGSLAKNLDEMSRRMDRLPQQDGHSGGISIRFNHPE